MDPYGYHSSPFVYGDGMHIRTQYLKINFIRTRADRIDVVIELSFGYCPGIIAVVSGYRAKHVEYAGGLLKKVHVLNLHQMAL